MSGVVKQQVPAGYQQTEVGVIPKDWSLKVLLELNLDISDGNYSSKYPRSDEFRVTGVPFIRANNIKNLTIVDDDMRFITFKKHSEITKGHLKKGDVLVTNRGEIGNLAIVPDRHIGSNINAQIVRINTNGSPIENLYFAYYLQKDEVQEKFSEMQTGSALKQLPVNRLKTLFVAYPAIDEQSLIANALSDVDALITSIEKLIAKKSAIKTAAMQQLLTGKKRLPPFDKAHTGYKQTELGEIPEDWEVIPIGAALAIRHGRDQKQVERPGGAYPILGTGGEMGRADTFLYNKPSVLIGRKGTINKPIYMSSPFWTVDTLFYSEVGRNYSAKFIYYKFCMINWLAYNEASGVPSLNSSTIESVLQSFPEDREEQVVIAGVLSDMDKEIFTLERRLHKTQKLKLSMMQELLTGRTRLV